MTLAEHCAWALLRSGAIALAAVVVACGVRGLVASMSRGAGRAVWAVHLAPFLTPVLLVGYAYSGFSLSLVHHPAWDQVLYTVLVWLKLAPVATVVLSFAPSPMSPEAVHCHRLLRVAEVRSARESLPFWVQSEGRAAAVAFALVFLLAFGEFELAASLAVGGWTVVLFDAQVGGLVLRESLRLALPALACEAAVLLGVFVLVVSAGARVYRPQRRGEVSRARSCLVAAYLAIAMAAVTVLPAAIVLRGTLKGLGLLAQTLRLSRDVGASALVGAAAAACAYLAAGRLLRPPLGRWRLLGGLVACVPGLLGPLVLSLLVLAVFQLPALRVAYDTPLPLVVALGLVLLPFALLVRALVAALRPGEAVHAARLLRASSSRRVARCGRDVVWELRSRGQFWAAFLLFCWGYFDLTASSVLAPSQMTPVLVRLYNFMHYGHSEVLSAMLCVAYLVPVAVLLAAVPARRLLHGAWTLVRDLGEGAHA